MTDMVGGFCNALETVLDSLDPCAGRGHREGCVCCVSVCICVCMHVHVQGKWGKGVGIKNSNAGFGFTAQQIVFVSTLLAWTCLAFGCVDRSREWGHFTHHHPFLEEKLKDCAACLGKEVDTADFF